MEQADVLLAGGDEAQLITGAENVEDVIVRLRGEIRGSRGFARFSAAQGTPDGMTVDADDNLWVALWGGGVVERFDASGTYLGGVRLPTPQPTAPCLIRLNGQTRLVVTTASRGLCGQSGNAGAVFAGTVTGKGRGARAASPFRLSSRAERV